MDPATVVGQLLRASEQRLQHEKHENAPGRCRTQIADESADTPGAVDNNPGVVVRR